MNYKPDAGMAFASVEYIMRDVDYGWLIRYMHSTGASMFFVVVYLHMFRGMMYGSYQKPRRLLWLSGYGNIPCTDEFSFYWIYLTLGTNVLLGRASDCKYVWSNSDYRRISPTMGVG